MTNNNPLVSIISPVYNRETLLDFTIQSVKNQTYTNWELLLIDDGSTDNSVKIIIEYAKEDDRIKLFERSEEPKGAQTCRNMGLKNAIGKYVIFLDSDDILAEFCLTERVYNFETNYPEKDFIVFPGLNFNYDLYDDKNFFISSYKGNDVIPLFLNRDVPWLNLNPIYKLSSLKSKLLDWNTDVCIFQDILFHVSCVFSGLEFAYAGTKPDCFWRSHKEGNIGNSHNYSHVYVVSMCNFFKILFDELKKVNKLTRYNKACLLNFALTCMSKLAYRNLDKQEVRFFVKGVDFIPFIEKVLFIIITYIPGIRLARAILNIYVKYIRKGNSSLFEVKYFLKINYSHFKKQCLNSQL